MKREETLSQKLFETINVMICQSKEARNYGTAHKLTYSDMGLLRSVRHYKQAKAGDLSGYLGITNGAVAQLAKKLTDKGYLEPYRMAGNKKEVYYRLTDAGQTACQGYDDYHAGLKGGVDAYSAGLDEETAGKISGLFDLVLQTTACWGRCSNRRGDGQTENDKRCEKCQTIY